MPDVVNQARKLIEVRLRELEDEANRLREALSGLSIDGRTPRRSPGSPRAVSGKAQRGTGKRAPRGQREAQFLAVLQRNPGAKVSEIAREMRVAPNQVYGLARRLQHSRKIAKRRGGGYAIEG
jgi:hypothetical protein